MLWYGSINANYLSVLTRSVICRNCNSSTDACVILGRGMKGGREVRREVGIAEHNESMKKRDRQRGERESWIRVCVCAYVYASKNKIQSFYFLP